MKVVHPKHRVSKVAADASCHSLRRSSRIRSSLPPIIRDSEESESGKSSLGDAIESSLSFKVKSNKKSKSLLNLSPKDAEEDYLLVPDKSHSALSDSSNTPNTNTLKSRQVKPASTKRKSTTNSENNILESKAPGPSSTSLSSLTSTPTSQPHLDVNGSTILNTQPRIAPCPDSEDEFISCDELSRDPCRSPIKKKLRVGIASHESSTAKSRSKGKGKEKELASPRLDTKSNNIDQLGIQSSRPRNDELSEADSVDSDLPLSTNMSTLAKVKSLGIKNQYSFYGDTECEKVISSSSNIQKNQNISVKASESTHARELSDSEMSDEDYLGQYSGVDSEYSSGEDEPLVNMTAHDTTLPSVSQSPSRRARRSRNSTKPKMSRIERERSRLESNHPEMKSMWDDLEHLPKIRDDVSFEQPKNITRELKPFQLQGVAWMKAMEETQWGGGLLGDEMGMGKTIQAVSLIMSDWPAKKPSLVLMPPVALLQWQHEINAYTDGALKTFVYHGTNAKSKGISKQDIMKFDVILMSYNSLESIYRKQEKGFKRKDGTFKEKSVIHQTRFHRVILDEAHCIKSRSTGSAKACFALQADHKWCLSGTPLQNRIGELFSLVRFLDIRPYICYFCKQCSCSTLNWNMDETNKCRTCKHNGMQHISLFNFEILNPIQKNGDRGPGADAFKKLRILTDRFMLRRLKCDHTSAMELPVKEIYVDRQFFGEEENDFAASIMNNGTRKFETYVAQGVVLNNYANIFGLILHMRQVADHPDLILKKNSEGGQNILSCCICDETAEEAIRSACRHDFCRECAKNYVKSFENPDCPQCHIQLSIDLEQPEIEQEETMIKKSSIINRIKMENWTSSTKIEALVHDLYKLRSKNMSHKSIIFSQFTTMLQLVEWRLRRAGITTVMLDGSMTPSQRQASIDHFMNNVNVECFLVSLKAGGVALNLTEASRVFIVDPWWNPAAEWQSADRCHRIGQTRPCTVTRLCIEDSVESRMVLLQEKKANMINSTINADQSAMESLTPEDMQFLFRGN